jgi:hypothetical protein
VVVGIDPGTNRARPRDHDSFSRVQVADRRPPDERITEREHCRGPSGLIDDEQAVIAAVEFQTDGDGCHGEQHAGRCRDRGGHADCTRSPPQK